PGADANAINAIKTRIISEMEVLERQRILGTLQSRSVSGSCESLRVLGGPPPGVQRAVDDPSGTPHPVNTVASSCRAERKLAKKAWPRQGCLPLRTPPRLDPPPHHRQGGLGYAAGTASGSAGP